MNNEFFLAVFSFALDDYGRKIRAGVVWFDCLLKVRFVNLNCLNLGLGYIGSYGVRFGYILSKWDVDRVDCLIIRLN